MVSSTKASATSPSPEYTASAPAARSSSSLREAGIEAVYGDATRSETLEVAARASTRIRGLSARAARITSGHGAAGRAVADDHRAVPRVWRATGRGSRGRRRRPRRAVDGGPQGRMRPQPSLDRADRAVEQGIEDDRDGRGRDQRVGRHRRQQAQLAADRREDEGELADLRQGDRHGERHGDWPAQGPHEHQRHGRLGDQHDGQRAEAQLTPISRAARPATYRRRNRVCGARPASRPADSRQSATGRAAG